MSKTNKLAIVLVVLGIGSLFGALLYGTYQTRPYQSGIEQNYQGMMSQWYPATQPNVQPGNGVTLEEAKAIAQQYLASTKNPDLATKEIMEFQYNFYITYYEKSTGIGAFEMLIWKEIPPSDMMGDGMIGIRYATPGVIMPEPGPNMMWNTKYSPMNNGMMNVHVIQGFSTMTISNDKAAQLAQEYLDSNFNNARIEMATKFYGYYTFDFAVDGKSAGMLSVNGYTGQVWYHSWHGAFIQELEFD